MPSKIFQLSVLFVFLSFFTIAEESTTGISYTQDSLPAWDINVEGYVQAYYDKGRNAFAINTVKQPTDQWAAATRKFQGKDGMYTVVFTSLLETDGECSYKLYINEKEILAFQNPRIYESGIKEYAPNEVKVDNVQITHGSLIKVEFLSNSNGLVPENDAFGYARARWREVQFVLHE